MPSTDPFDQMIVESNMAIPHEVARLWLRNLVGNDCGKVFDPENPCVCARLLWAYIDQQKEHGEIMHRFLMRDPELAKKAEAELEMLRGEMGGQG